jgi:benzoate-CoA ligase
MSEQLVPVISEIKGDLRYIRDVIIISDTKGAHIPFKQMYRHAPAKLKTESTTKDDIGFWLYSSGSTGSPKGAIHSHYDMVVATEGFGRGVLGLTENDIVFSAARLFFAYGLGNSCYLPFGVGASVILNSEAPKPENVLRLIERFRPTVFFDIPTYYGQMLEYLEKRDQQAGTKPDPNAAHEFSSVRICCSAGEALPPELYHRWKQRFGLDILDGLGTSELLHIFICNRPGEVRPGSTMKVGRFPRVGSAHFSLKAGPPPSSIGGDGKKRSLRCRANGSTPATNTMRMPTVTSGAPAVPTICLKSVTSGFLRLRSKTASGSIPPF